MKTLSPLDGLNLLMFNVVVEEPFLVPKIDKSFILLTVEELEFSFNRFVVLFNNKERQLVKHDFETVSLISNTVLPDLSALPTPADFDEDNR